MPVQGPKERFRAPGPGSRAHAASKAGLRLWPAPPWVLRGRSSIWAGASVDVPWVPPMLWGLRGRSVGVLFLFVQLEVLSVYREAIAQLKFLDGLSEVLHVGQETKTT